MPQSDPQSVRYRLSDAVGSLRGIGPRWAEELGGVGVVTIADLLEHFPFRYADRRDVRPINDLRAGEPATAMGIVRSVTTARTRRRGLEVLTVLLDDGTAALRVVFYGRSYLAEYIREDARLLVSGTPRRGRAGLELQGPEFEVLREGEDPNERTGWIPVYEKLGPLSGRRLRTVIAEALDGLGEPPDVVPEPLRARRKLVPLGDALRSVHLPEPEVDGALLESRWTPGHRRLAYEEFFLLELGLAIRRQQGRLERRTQGYRIDDALRARLHALLPFELTGAQQRSLAEIEGDLSQPWPMGRLLLGDVGSGK
ncbi:MAG: OB-fold nucleic acid binding domain-containing protein, partial [Kangiellaceae bacterium]|nr:OB-fold nucleic acid binding domain-containing protein [Kangiellaceae bacterium]